MSRKVENQGFICENCNEKVLPLTNGSYRNHCPFCLYSKHVDNKPGDRMNSCNGLMRAVRIKYTGKKGLQIIHKCLICGEVKVNRIADNCNQRDDFEKILKLMNSV